MSKKQAKARAKVLAKKQVMVMTLQDSVTPIKVQARQFHIPAKVKSYGFVDMTKRTVKAKQVMEKKPNDINKMIIDYRYDNEVNHMVKTLKKQKNMPNPKRVDSDYVKPKFQSVKTKSNGMRRLVLKRQALRIRLLS